MHHVQTLPVRKHNSSLWLFKELVERENEAGHRADPEWSFLLCSRFWTWTFKKWRVIQAKEMKMRNINTEQSAILGDCRKWGKEKSEGWLLGFHLRKWGFPLPWDRKNRRCRCGWKDDKFNFSTLVKAVVFQWSCMDVKVGLWRKLSTEELMLLNCGVWEDSWESLGLQGDPTSPS